MLEVQKKVVHPGHCPKCGDEEWIAFCPHCDKPICDDCGDDYQACFEQYGDKPDHLYCPDCYEFDHDDHMNPCGGCAWAESYDG